VNLDLPRSLVRLRPPDLREVIATRSATVGVVGLGYVGLPLAMAAAHAGFTVVGFDEDAYADVFGA